jgi:coenzyme F420-reducing hydrogenase delta subunit
MLVDSLLDQIRVQDKQGFRKDLFGISETVKQVLLEVSRKGKVMSENETRKIQNWFDRFYRGLERIEPESKI